MGKLISDKYKAWEEECRNRFDTLKRNEEELNKIFIDIYGLQDELTPEEDDKDVTVRLADKNREIMSLISYLIGCLMGRYSLIQEGLVYAGGDFDPSKYGIYPISEDGVLPIYYLSNVNGDLSSLIFKLIKQIYGEDTFNQNIDFIADALVRKNNETSMDTIVRYIKNDFYKDHCAIYQKRPIYWMFSSGKLGAFKCLIYLHRYSKNTLGNIYLKYFLPTVQLFKNEKERLESSMNSNNLDNRAKLSYSKQISEINNCLEEMELYGQALEHKANQNINIDLDDGVLVNYDKFQNIEVQTDSGLVKVNLLEKVK